MLQDYFENNVVWRVTLNNGEVLTSLPDFNWKDLKKKVKSEGTTINSLSLVFRDNVLSVFDNDAEGYYLVDGFSGDINIEVRATKIVGTILGAVCKIQEVRIPELIVMRTEYREVHKCIRDAIIWKQGYPKLYDFPS
jgi:hypothetical protein